MTIKELAQSLVTMMESNMVLPECEIKIHDVINDEPLEIVGFDVYADGSLDIKAREM